MKKFITIITFIFCLPLLTVGQTVVNPGAETLNQAISSASTGAVLLLTPGGSYTTADTTFGIITGKKITIKSSQPSNSNKPKLTCTYVVGTTGPQVRFFILGNGSGLTLDGLEIAGDISGTAKHRNMISYPVPSTAIAVGTLAIKNCTIHDFVNDMVDGASSSNFYLVTQDSILIDNSVIYNFGTSPASGTSGSIVQYKYANCNFFTMKNSTAYKINAYGLRFEGGSSYPNTFPPQGEIDHCTFNYVGGGKNIILVDYSTKTWLITNTIFSNIQLNTQKGVYFKITSGTTKPATLNKVSFWNEGLKDFVGINPPAATDTMRIDPGYANAANGDFTLPAGSPLLTYGTDGHAIGDPRWSGPVGVEDSFGNIPSEYALQQNYPNPFNPTTRMAFSIPKEGYARLAVYDLLGREVALLINERLSAGYHSINFNAGNLSTGVYIYRLSCNDFTTSRKMLLMK